MPARGNGTRPAFRNWYATGMARVRAVRAALSQWESLPAVRRLDDKLYDWSTTLNALTGG